jgi:hypothetical protein
MTITLAWGIVEIAVQIFEEGVVAFIICFGKEVLIARVTMEFHDGQASRRGPR